MSDSKKQPYNPEAPTLVASNGSSPSAPDNDPATHVDIRPDPSHSSDAPTILTSVRPPADPSADDVTVISGTSQRSAEAGDVLQTGTLFANRYRISRILGEGGMGAVYKARDVELERDVALKVIKPELAHNPEILQRFKQELILARQVTDRNIIRIFDLGEAGRTRFITMEYIDGQNLHQLLKAKGKLELKEAVEIMEQVASGLAAAHREGIIHRDLKPGNIMCDKNGRVVVMDFGLARTISGDGMTRAGAMLGTIDYMSPEQAQGKDLSASSDIFTFGLILYELIAGVMPFYAESAIASLVKRTQERAVPLADIDRNVPGAINNIVCKCLEKDAAKRYQNAAELDQDLRIWQGRADGKRVSVSSTRLWLNRLGELPWLPGLAVACLLTIVIAPSVTWFVAHKIRQSAQLAAHGPVSVLVGDFANQTGDPVLDNTLEPMLNLALEGASFINSYSRADARKLAEKLPHPTDKLDEQSARLVAVSQGVNAIITGDISLRGDQYDISAVALDAVSGKVLAKSDITVTNKQDIVKSLPKLAAPLRTALGDTTPASVQFDAVSGGFTAASLEAVHQDALGVDEQFAGNFQQSFDSFQKAVELDPNFARAYSGMAAMAQNLGRPADALKYMNLAMQHVDRMTDRERYRYRGLYYLTAGDWQNCVQEYTQLTNHYPADRVGQNNLATCYTQLRNAPKALEAARAAVQIVPKGVGPRLNLAFISVFAGNFADGEKEARTALSISPSAGQGYLVLAEAQLGQGELDKAADSYHQLESFGPAAKSTAADGLADLAAYQGKYTDSEQILSDGAKTDLSAKMNDNAARKYAALGSIEEMLGNRTAALADLSKALANSQSPQIKFLTANAYVDLGEIPRAQALATSLSSSLTGESQAYGNIVTGMIALKRKNANEAIKQLTAANNALDTWIGRFELGRAYLEAGAFTQADSEFDGTTKRRGEAIELFMDNVPTSAYFPPVIYFEGRAREGMKSTDFSDFYKSYLQIRGQSKDDPLVADIKHRAAQ